jgi:ABC-type nitrate/sulfonate/bicarbonate transport system substrate-binding protein
MNGRFVKAVLLGALMTTVMTTAAQAQQPRTTLQVNVFREDPATAVGRVKGFFAAEGLDLKITTTRNSTDQMRGLSNGTFHIASTAFDNVLAWSGREGAELIAVSQIVDSTVFPVFVRPEIKTWNELRGRKLAVDAVDTAFALVLRRVLLDQGLDLTRRDYEFVPVGATALRLESLVKGETFAAVLTSPEDTKALAAGMVRLGDSSKSLPGFPFTLFATERGWAQKERARLVGFINGWLAAANWMRTNRDEAIQIAQAEIKLDPKVAASQVDETSKTGALNPAGLELVLNLRNQFGMTPKMGPKVARYYDAQYYDAAAGR